LREVRPPVIEGEEAQRGEGTEIKGKRVRSGKKNKKLLIIKKEMNRQREALGKEKTTTKDKEGNTTFKKKGGPC